MRVAAAPALAVMAVLVAGKPAAAAGSDCGKAATVREKLLCSDSQLAAADDRLVKAYRAALEPLSKESRAALRDAQQQWLHFSDAQCGTGGSAPPASANAYNTPQACLLTQYEVRQRQLDHATVRSGTLVIARRERFSAVASADIDHIETRDLAYPQIDRPKSAAAARWNALMRQQVEHLAPPSNNGRFDRMVDYRIASASSALISVVFTDYAYVHGAAHGSETVHAVNWLLVAQRALVAADLFDPAKPWIDTLAERGFAGLSAQIEKPMLFAKGPAEIDAMVQKPERWAIQPQGLGVLFQQYEVGPYAIGHPEIVVPWPALQPVLNSKPGFPLPPPG